MKKKNLNKSLKLNKISVANLSKIDGGQRNIRKSFFRLCNTTDPTAQTYCYVCDDIRQDIY